MIDEEQDRKRLNNWYIYTNHYVTTRWRYLLRIYEEFRRGLEVGDRSMVKKKSLMLSAKGEKDLDCRRNKQVTIQGLTRSLYLSGNDECGEEGRRWMVWGRAVVDAVKVSEGGRWIIWRGRYVDAVRDGGDGTMKRKVDGCCEWECCRWMLWRRKLMDAVSEKVKDGCCEKSWWMEKVKKKKLKMDAVREKVEDECYEWESWWMLWLRKLKEMDAVRW